MCVQKTNSTSVGHLLGSLGKSRGFDQVKCQSCSRTNEQMSGGLTRHLRSRSTAAPTALYTNHSNDQRTTNHVQWPALYTNHSNDQRTTNHIQRPHQRHCTPTTATTNVQLITFNGLTNGTVHQPRQRPTYSYTVHSTSFHLQLTTKAIFQNVISHAMKHLIEVFYVRFSESRHMRRRQSLTFYFETKLITRHRTSASTCWHFTFGAILTQQWNLCTNCKSAQ